MILRPFRAVRPRADLAGEVAALPYDVYTRKEAKEAVRGKPLSFLNIDRPETMFPDETDMYDPKVYLAAGKRYLSERKEGIYIMEERPCFYLYELTMRGRTQTGIGGLSAAEDYLSGAIRRHEATVTAKEKDRISHIEALNAQTGPIFMAYREDSGLRELKKRLKETYEPRYDFVSDDGIGHRLWIVDDPEEIAYIGESFSGMRQSYIADGHHRAASAVSVFLKGHGPGYFLSVLFPEDELTILDYNRVVTDLNGMPAKEFLTGLSDIFSIDYIGSADKAGAQALKPGQKYDIGLYLSGDIYMMSLKDEIREEVKRDPIRSLDTSILQDYVLDGLLGITDPRNDSRLRFIGGVKGMEGLIGAADETGGAAFSLYPTGMDELMRVADLKLLMPPKSTWFEPKLRSGLLIYEF